MKISEVIKLPVSLNAKFHLMFYSLIADVYFPVKNFLMELAVIFKDELSAGIEANQYRIDTNSIHFLVTLVYLYLLAVLTFLFIFLEGVWTLFCFSIHDLVSIPIELALTIIFDRKQVAYELKVLKDIRLKNFLKRFKDIFGDF